MTNPISSIAFIYVVLYIGLTTIFWFIFKLAFVLMLLFGVIFVLGSGVIAVNDLFEKYNQQIKKISIGLLGVAGLTFAGLVVFLFTA